MIALLTTLIVVWTVVTTAVIILAYIRLTLGMHDIVRVRLSSEPGESLDPNDIKRRERIAMTDRFGIPLTVLSALLALAILVVWALGEAGPG